VGKRGAEIQFLCWVKNPIQYLGSQMENIYAISSYFAFQRQDTIMLRLPPNVVKVYQHFFFLANDKLKRI
jgi:hypothetical protein